ncbi:hypothetical protein V6N13_090494 [Hibiscus sabdariffa]
MLSAIPYYSMQSSLLPKGTCEEIENRYRTEVSDSGNCAPKCRFSYEVGFSPTTQDEPFMGPNSPSARGNLVAFLRMPKELEDVLDTPSACGVWGIDQPSIQAATTLEHPARTTARVVCEAPRQEGSPMAQYVGPVDQENIAVLRKPPETAMNRGTRYR